MGSKITLSFVECSDIDKESVVKPEGLFEGDIVKILEIVGEFECDGKKYKIAKVMREKE